LILALFSLTLPLRWSKAYGLTAQADKLRIREESLGDVELTDRAFRLVLTGSRGFAVCALWYYAQDLQQRHEWNEVELLVRSVIKLQPHFETPWLFQSWNLAYNVSVECDRVKDKYFYISRGIGLLAEGDRINRDNPNIRFFVGNYTQMKMGISDENNTLRSLYQMSCIDPRERDPARFRRIVDGRNVIDLDQFEDFCRHHPFLVRRLHDTLRCKTPDDVIDFLAANQKIPSRYEDRPQSDDSDQAIPYKPVAERWPVLPPAQAFDKNELTYDSDLGDDFDNYAAARAWYGYAQDPLEAGRRAPRFMMQIIFENYPARAQSYVGERLEQEGWFDTDGWEIKNWIPKEAANPRGLKRAVRVGTERQWAHEAWKKAYEMYEDYGKSKGLYKTPEEEKNLSDTERGEWESRCTVTNFPHHYHKARVEMEPRTVTARKQFFKADELRKSGDRELALAVYERPDAFAAWKKVLLDNAMFRSDLDVQEETYVMQRKYISLVKDKRAAIVRGMLQVQDLLTLGAIDAPGPRLWASAYWIPILKTPLHGPFDDVAPDGSPLITERAIAAALEHYNLSRDPDRPVPPIDKSKLPPLMKPVPTGKIVAIPP
jgi:hypothetical protein